MDFSLLMYRITKQVIYTRYFFTVIVQLVPSKLPRSCGLSGKKHVPTGQEKQILITSENYQLLGFF